MVAFAPSPPDDLTIPKSGSTTLRAIWSMSLRKLFEDFKTLHAPASASAQAKADYRALREVLVGFLPGKPGAIANLLRRPTISAPLRCLRDGAGDPDALIAEVVGQSLFMLANVGALDTPVEIRTLPDVLMDPHRGIHLDVRGARSVTFGTEIGVDGEPHEPSRGAFVDVDGEIVLCTLDNNPLRDVEAHPDKQGNAVDLGGHPSGEWVDTLRAALAIIERTLPDFRAEIDLILQHVVPVGWDDEAHLSASYRESLGTIYLTLHPNVLTMAGALIHEVSHNKLNALLELDPVLRNGTSATFASPVRPDPRPLMGVLLAVHAFQPVARMLEQLDDPKLEPRLEQVKRQNREGVKVLEAADATAVGQGLLDEIRRWDAHFSS